MAEYYLGDVLGDSKDINESSNIIVTDRILRQDIIVLVVAEGNAEAYACWFGVLPVSSY